MVTALMGRLCKTVDFDVVVAVVVVVVVVAVNWLVGWQALVASVEMDVVVAAGSLVGVFCCLLILDVGSLIVVVGSNGQNLTVVLR